MLMWHKIRGVWTPPPPWSAVFTNNGALVRASPDSSAFFFLFFPSPSNFFSNGCPPNLSHIINLFWVGQYRGIFSSQVMYCPSLWSGQYCHPRTEYSPVLPSQSCNNIYVLNVIQILFLGPKSLNSKINFLAGNYVEYTNNNNKKT